MALYMNGNNVMIDFNKSKLRFYVLERKQKFEESLQFSCEQNGKFVGSIRKSQGTSANKEFHYLVRMKLCKLIDHMRILQL